MMFSRFYTTILTAYSLSQAIDYFPVETGRSWVFSYVDFCGHSGGGTTKEGSIRWTIGSKTVRNTLNGASVVKVIQKNELKRKKYSYLDRANNYDSLFDPPRVSVDTLTFIDSANVCIETATGRILVHDPQMLVPGKYCIIDSSLVINGSILACVIPIDTPCGLHPDGDSKSARHPEYHYFFQNQSFGLVKYFFNSHGDFEFEGGVNWSEWIIQLQTSNRYFSSRQRPSHPGTIGNCMNVYSINGSKMPLSKRLCTGTYLMKSTDGSPKLKKTVFFPVGKQVNPYDNKPSQ